MWNQKGLYLQLKKWLDQSQKVIIFTDEQERLPLERALLEINQGKAFFHIQVTSFQTYAFNLLAKHRLFQYRLLSPVKKWVAIREALKVEGLEYFYTEKPDAGMMKALSNVFETFADMLDC